jgi:chromosome segregation ATPase
MADEKEVQQAKEKLEGLLGAMEQEKPSGSAFSFMGGKPSSKSPGKGFTGKGGGEASERLRALEEELAKEKEKAMRAEILLKEKENVRLEMESLFRGMKDQMMKERMSQEMDSERQNARARVETLEKRLDEVSRLLVQALQQKRSPDEEFLSGDILKEILSRQNEFTAAMARKDEEVARLRAALDESVSKSEERFRKASEDLRLELLSKNRELAELAALRETYARLKEAHDSLQALVGPEGAPLRDLVKTLRCEIEGLRQTNVSLKSALQDLELRHEQLRTENRSLLRRLDDKEAALASHRLKQLPEEMTRLERAVNEALSAPAGQAPALDSFRDLIEEKEKNLREIREQLERSGGDGPSA